MHSEGCIAAALAQRISHASLAAVLSKLGQDTVLAESVRTYVWRETPIAEVLVPSLPRLKII